MIAENVLGWLSIPTGAVMTAGLILYVCGIAGKQFRNISASGFRSTFLKSIIAYMRFPQLGQVKK
jgi:hypothetical protein